ncbi:MAG: DUF885 domain-containing protein [Gemmatimonadetes bacterium]|nr:DUF885 domain-containing protein [Gemmatimonadota bacterium]
MRLPTLPLLLIAALFAATPPLAAQLGGDPAVPALAPIVGPEESDMVRLVERFREDDGALRRRYDAPWSAEAGDRMTRFYAGWRDRLRELDFAALDAESRIDWVLLDYELRYRLSELERQAGLYAQTQPLVPFAEDLVALHEARRRMEPVDGREVAARLAAMPARIAAAREAAEAAVAKGGKDAPSPIVGMRAADAVDAIRGSLRRWYAFHAGYDPAFTWWVSDPYERVDRALEEYGGFLRRRVVGHAEGEDPPVVGDPIGAAGMEADLLHEMIPYSPAELIRLAERELAWSEAEMRKAAREMGYGEDWKAALEHVKTLHVEPGEQPALVIRLAEEAIAFVKERGLVTVPPLAEEVWRMEMLSPERQKVSPFFLGGEVFRVSYPTDEMEHADKLMSMRGNNEHFSRAVAHHELIPGHHLQGFMTDRYNSHRQLFRTPFWHEGNALYWEFRLWDLGFARGPEDRVGMLFWRMHRAARIIFSLSFHLERMTPQEAVDFLVERVGHERANAEAEVRRSFNGSYPPLYQAGYMLGGLQFRALHRDLVESGRMSEREFHDAILRGGPMPVEMVRARLTGQALERGHRPSWRFYGDLR